MEKAMTSETHKKDQDIELEIGRVYKTSTNNIVKVISIDNDKDELHVYNISESCNIWTKFSRHNLTQKIR